MQLFIKDLGIYLASSNIFLVNINFNYFIITNVIYISGSLVLYIVNKAICFQATK